MALGSWGEEGTSRISTLLYIAVTITITYLTYQAIYNLYFHPLRSFPGPVSHRAFSLPYIWQSLAGRAAFHAHELHERYGPIVRLTPNHLSFTDVRAWREIYGHRIPPRPSTTTTSTTTTTTLNGISSSNPQTDDIASPSLDENPKSPIYYGFFPEITPSIIEAPRDLHALLRKAISHGFSERALRSQESRIQRYVDFLMLRLRQNARKGTAKLDIVDWYNWAAFDIIGDLVFAESFGCLERQEYHPFVRLIVGTIQGGMLLVALNYLGLGWITMLFWRLGVSKLVYELRAGLRGKIQRRVDLGKEGEREDLFEGLMKHREDWGIGMGGLTSNAVILVAAGSETTATLLAGVTYLLLSNPEALANLKIEVRSTFNSAGEITIASASRLPYMLACLNEALRMYPPVTGSLVRVIAKGGTTVAGHVLPGGTMVECSQWAMHHSSTNWQDPWSFRPERFLDKGGLGKKDTFEALQPFSVGPRNCVGKNLAYAEMRLILANMIYNFDLTLAEESKTWLEKQRAYPLWLKGPLYIHVEPVFE